MYSIYLFIIPVKEKEKERKENHQKLQEQDEKTDLMLQQIMEHANAAEDAHKKMEEKLKQMIETMVNNENVYRTLQKMLV